MDTLFTVEQLDESDFLQASENPFNNDKTTVCKCKDGKFMYLQERGRNAFPCKNAGRNIRTTRASVSPGFPNTTKQCFQLFIWLLK